MRLETATLQEFGHLPIFAGLSPDEARQFLGLSQRIVVPIGTDLIRAGEPADSFYLILRGVVEVRITQQGVSLPVAQLQAAQLIGEMAFFQATPFRLADAFIVREALLCKFPFARVHEACARDPALGDKIRRNLRYISQMRARENVARKERSDQGAPLTPIQKRMALVRCPAFAGASSEELSDLLHVADPMRYRALEPVITAGEPADCLYVVALGHLEVRIATHEGVFSVAQIGAGQVVGELPLVYDLETRTASVFASQPTTLLRLEYADLERVLRGWDGAWDRFMGNVGKLATTRAEHLAELEHGAPEGAEAQAPG